MFLELSTTKGLYWFIEDTRYKLVGCPRGVMVKVMDSGIVVREFVLQ